MAVINGTISADNLVGLEEADQISGFAGNDTLTGLGGDDQIDGGADRDSILGGLGNDILRGGDGDDFFVFGDAGDDFIYGDAGSDSLSGGIGNDLLDGGVGLDTLLGGDGNDQLFGAADADRLFGNAGDDTLDGGAGADSLDGSDGADTLVGGDDFDTLRGGNGDDQLNGGAGNDSLDGGAGFGDFVVYTGLTSPVSVNLTTGAASGVQSGTDVLVGIENVITGEGADNIIGATGANTISGAGGADSIDGGGGNDELLGGAGSDTVSGASGDDQIFGDEPFAPSQTSTATGAVAGQPIAISLTGARWDSDGSTNVVGYVDNRPPSSTRINVVYVIDVSGSMRDQFLGNELVGDLNNDGLRNTLLDGAIAGYASLNQSIIDAGLGRTTNVSVVTFSSGYDIVFNGSAGQDVDSDGVVDVVEALQALRDGGGTNYDDGLAGAILALNGAATEANYVFFMSDGEPNGGPYTDEVQTLLTGFGARIRAIGLGNGASLPALDLVDDALANNTAERALTPTQLGAGLSDPGIDLALINRVEVLVNGALAVTIPASQLEATPFGYKYVADLSGLSLTSPDLITARVITNTVFTVLPTSITIAQADATPGAADTLFGGEGNDRIEGNAGDDRIEAGVGDDVLIGGPGNDTLDGGAGYDTADYSAEFQPVAINLLNQTVTGLGVDTLVSIENASGGFGNDTIIGGAGGTRVVAPPVAKPASTIHSTTATAINLDGRFGLQRNDTVANSTTVPHATVNAQGSGQAEFYSFTVSAPSTVTLDIDATSTGFDSSITLLNASGGTVTSNNNFSPADPGSTTTNDSFLTTSITTPGTYFVRVQASGGTTVPTGASYTLHVSVTAPVLATTTEPLPPLLEGGGGSDQIISTTPGATLVGGDGDDALVGSAGVDLMNGGQGFDRMFGGEGDDTMFGAGGINIYDGGGGNDVMRPNFLNFENQVILAGPGNDVGGGGEVRDWLYGGDGADTLSGAGGEDFLVGETGADVLSGEAGDDVIFGGEGGDTINGGLGIDYIYGEAGDDVIDGGSGLSVGLLSGGEGNDRISAGVGTEGPAVIWGDGGNDTGIGGGAADYFIMDIGNDSVDAGLGNDILIMGAGDDVALGGGGDDLIFGGAGTNIYDGGAGANYHILEAGAVDTIVVRPSDGIQYVYGFEPGAGPDVVRITGGSNLTSFAALQNAGAIQDLNATLGFTQISVGGTGRVMLMGIAANQLTAADFLFG